MVYFPHLLDNACKCEFGKYSFDFNPDFIANFGARDKDNKTFNPCNAVSLTSNILNSYIVNFALFDRD
jgi:hypothetical protein